MHPRSQLIRWQALVFASFLIMVPTIDAADLVPGTTPLTREGDLAAQMVAGIDRSLTKMTAATKTTREALWKSDFTSADAYVKSVAPNRASLAKSLGVIDTRVPPKLEYVGGPDEPALILETKRYRIYAVRWAVLPGMDAEGLLLEPTAPAIGQVVAIPDAMQTPEAIAGLVPGIPDIDRTAQTLAVAGFRVLVPMLIDRENDLSMNARMNRRTNISHREFIYRQAYEMGRHIIGYEVQKVLAGVDWFARKPGHAPIGVVGYGDGGMIAMFAAALDSRIQSTVVSGYFGTRNLLYSEPIDRNVWNLLREFGDAGIGRLILPRGLVIDPRPGPKYAGPAAVKPGQSASAAPGVLGANLELNDFYEYAQLNTWGRDAGKPLRTKLSRFAKDDTNWLTPFADHLGVKMQVIQAESEVDRPLRTFDPKPRQQRQFDQMVAYTQKLWRDSDITRVNFWKDANPTTVTTWENTTSKYRDYFWNEVMGKLPKPTIATAPKSRPIYNTPKWAGYEITLDIDADEFAYGILLLPKDLKPGEKRPVVVCQHGLEGRPTDICDPTKSTPYYHSFGAQLADLGYIVYAPQNAYIGKDAFRVLQRKANPLKLSLFSFIIRQHETTLDWLATLPMVQADKIAFYGLSYGGKTAMRVPALLPRYCLSICSGDFNEWIGKNVSTEFRSTYMYTYEYEMPEFDLGSTFNYAEMAYLIAPKPFMVERGHDDGVGVDEMVAYEYAKIRYLYANKLKIPDRTTIEFFVGGHEIHSKGTFAFLKQHLQYPK